jgi:hypothetical protein
MLINSSPKMIEAMGEFPNLEQVWVILFLRVITCQLMPIALSTVGHRQITSSTLPPNQTPCTLTFSSTTLMGALMWWRHCQTWQLLQMVHITTENQPLSTLQIASVLPTLRLPSLQPLWKPSCRTLPIDPTYCIQLAGDGPYGAVGIIVCNHIVVAIFVMQST